MPQPRDIPPDVVDAITQRIAQFALGVLRRRSHVSVSVPEAVQAIWLEILPDLRANTSISLLHVDDVLGARERGLTRRVIGRLERASRRHQRRERPLDALAHGPVRPQAAESVRADELDRLEPNLRRAYEEQLRLKDADLCTLVLGIPSLELVRRLGWARAHLSDDERRLPPQAGAEPKWLATAPRRLRYTAYRLLAPVGWAQPLWLSETGRTAGALRADLCRARVSLRLVRVGKSTRL